MAWFRRRRQAVATADAAPARAPIGVPRAVVTLLGVGVAGLLLYLATQIGDKSTGDYWAEYGIVAGAGLTMALSQVLGGWTKWGMPRISPAVFVLGFLPVLIVGGWILLAHQPAANTYRTHVLNWSGDLGVRSFVTDWKEMLPALSFGIGLVFGFCFDTTGRRLARQTPAALAPGAYERDVAADEPVTAERSTVSTGDGNRKTVGAAQRPPAEAAPPDDSA